jgi:hypothetical protein
MTKLPVLSLRADPAEASALRRRTALALLAALMSLPALPACALDARIRSQPVEMAIIDRDTGLPLTVYRKDGRWHVAGQPSARYAIRLANHSGGRVLVVLSVDGINAVSGETAAFDQTGYVLDPWRTYDIAGWRKSDTAIAAFEFAALAESYAARTGRPGNVGVIGAAVFVEKPVPQAVLPLPAPQTTAEATAGAGEPGLRAQAARPAAPEARAQGPAFDRAESATNGSGSGRLAQKAERLGTAHGQREWSVSSRTSFERLSRSPQQLVEIAYDSHANLVAAGVIARPSSQARARAFPNDDLPGFVPDPPAR